MIPTVKDANRNAFISLIFSSSRFDGTSLTKFKICSLFGLSSVSSNALKLIVLFECNELIFLH